MQLPTVAVSALSVTTFFLLLFFNIPKYDYAFLDVVPVMALFGNAI